MHKNVKSFSRPSAISSKFEQSLGAIVIAEADNEIVMVTAIQLRNMEEEQKTDRSTAEQVAKIIHFLRNIED